MNNRISSEVKAANALAAESDAAKTEAGKRLEDLFKQYNVPLDFDPVKVLTGFGALVRAIGAEAQQQDVVHGGGTGEHKGLAAERNDAVHFVTDLLRSGRRDFSSRFTKASAVEVFTEGKPPTDPSKLNHYANGVIANLVGRTAAWTPRLHTVALDPAAYVAELNTVNTQLKTALDAVQKADGALSTTLTTRNATGDDLHNGLKGLGLIVSGFLEFGGDHERADHLRTHHHVGHPTTATTPVAAPDSKPKS